MWVLDQYYSDFPVYNPTLLNLPKSILSKKMSAFKIYNLGEGKISCLMSDVLKLSMICRYLRLISVHLPTENGTNSTTGQSKTMISAASGKRDNSHNEFYYEEAEMERRIRKRKAR